MERLEDQPIIDAHQHLWDLERIQLPWLHDPAYVRLARNFSVADYAEATRGAQVAKTVYVEVDARPADHDAETEYALEICRDATSRLAGVVCGARPAAEGFADRLRHLARTPYIKGVREILFDRPAGYCLDEAFLEGVRQLGPAGISFDIEMPLENLADAETLISSCPDTYFVVDHCGHPDLSDLNVGDWKTHISRIAELDNAAIKLSGLFSGAPRHVVTPEAIEPIVNHLFQAFGSTRLVFGSDWPVVTLTSSFPEWLGAVWSVVEQRSPQERQRLFHDNAAEIYRLK